jgi:hypothetical protein
MAGQCEFPRSLDKAVAWVSTLSFWIVVPQLS